MIEMNKIAVLNSQLEIVGLLAVASAIPVSNHVPVRIVESTVPVFTSVPIESKSHWGNGHIWNSMYEAYENGDWEALAEAAMG